jgi:RNA polymerase sigma factor (sigma-70 family)
MAMPDVIKHPPDPSLTARIAQLGAHHQLIETLCAQAGVTRFGWTAESLLPHLARSVASRFKGLTPTARELEGYLGSLCLEDFALACACSEGQEAAWDFFVDNYRGYLRRCAGAMLHRGAEAPEAREQADSLFAELYGLADGRGGTASLFRYFHGRSSLKTWLRAVLAQRHVDGIRATRRFDSLDDEDGAAERRQKNSVRSPTEPTVGPLAIAPDPYREKYIALFCNALQGALQRLDAADRRRVCLYYAEGKKLAEVGRLCGEHESSVSRNLERIRRELRASVEENLRRGSSGNSSANDGAASGQGLSDAQIVLCLQYATEESSIDFSLLFPGDPLTTDMPPGENS